MKHSRISSRRALVAGTGVAALLTATLSLHSAQAATTPAAEGLTATQASEMSTSIQGDLKQNAAGSYYDAKAKKLVVNVVNESDASTVRAAGAEPRTVKYSTAELNAAQRTLADQATVPGTAWSADPRSNKVTVTVDPTVTGADLTKVHKAVAALGDKARTRHSADAFQPMLAGGDAIWGSSARCSLGFNVTKGGEAYFLTAGHCTNAVQSWSDSQGGGQVAATEGGTFPGHDYGLAKYTSNVAHPSSVNLYGGSQNITQAGTPTVGQTVQRSGSTTGVHSGSVTALNATVNYAEGTVNGLIQTTVCAEPGDSGGSLFSGSTALGLTSGGSGNCSSGGETFFQPVPEALQAFGAEIG